MDDATLQMLGKAAWTGAVAGLTTVLGMTAIGLPISYAMNRMIYHTGGMRLVAGILSVFLLPVFIVLMLIGVVTNWFGMETLRQIPYFGMFPLKLITDVTPDEPEGWWALVIKAINVIMHPFNFYYDASAYRDVIKSLFAAEGQPTVDEKLFEGARRIAAISDVDEWRAAYEELASSTRRVGRSTATAVSTGGSGLPSAAVINPGGSGMTAPLSTGMTAGLSTGMTAPLSTPAT